MSNDIDESIIYIGMSADIIHHGHINILKEASKYGLVIVGLLTDSAIKSYKRDVIIPYINRLKVIESIKYVHQVVKQDTLSYVDNLRNIKPKYVMHGDDWSIGVQKDTRNEVLNTLKEWDGILIEIPYTKGISTTDIIRKIYLMSK